MKQTKQSASNQEKHKFSPECFNTCIEWKLNACVNHNKNSLGYIFEGKSLFFKKLSGSVLNTLQNKYAADATSIKRCLREFKEKSYADLDRHHLDTSYLKENDIMNLKFPIDNSKFNFMIIDANLSLNENLHNIFFLEFDMTKPLCNKEKLRILREINNDCVEREIFFVLNGTIHGIDIFKSEINFSVETRKFIKSMQFRLETYKTDLIQKNRMRKDSDNKQVNQKNIFYTKVLSNTNIGIEFYKPTFEPSVEKFPTNFNSIVNSNILVNKIYLEVCIPKIFIDSGLTLTIPQTKKENEQNKIIEIDINMNKQNVCVNNNNNNLNFNLNNIDVNPVDTSQDIKKFPIPVTHKEDLFNTRNESKSTAGEIIYKPQAINRKFFSSKPNSPVTDVYRNGLNLNMNMNIPPTVRSPDFLTKNLNFNIFNNGMLLNHTNTFQQHQHPYSSISSNQSVSMSDHYMQNAQNTSMNYMRPDLASLNPPGYKTNTHIRNNSINRRLSEHVYNKLKENPLNMMNNMNQIHPIKMNSIRSPPVMLKVNPDVMFANNPRNLMSMMSSNSINMSNLTNPGSNRSSYSHNFNLSSPPDESNLMDKNVMLGEYSNVMNNGFLSPRSYNFNQMQINPLQSKLHQYEGKRSYDFNQIESNSNFTIPNKFSHNYIQNTRKSSYKIKNNQILNLNNLSSQFEGSCNFYIFMRACTPHIYRKEVNEIKNLRLAEFFKNFEKVSTFGLDLNYFNDNEMINLSYSVTLSSLEINIGQSSKIFLTILEEFAKISHTSKEKEIFIQKLLQHQKEIPEGRLDTNLQPSEEILNTSYERYLAEGNNLKVIVKYDLIKFEFYEIRPPHSRQILISQIQDLLNSFEIIKKIPISEIMKDSVFSVLYSPFKSTKGMMMNSSFLVYYQINPDMNTSEILKNMTTHYVNKNFLELNLIGVLPIKFDHKMFLNPINKTIRSSIYSQPINNTNLINSNNYSFENVNNHITLNSKKNSADYEYYLKNSNYTF